MSSGESARTRIKFCGLTRSEDAILAAELGVDWLGFVFVPGSPRAVTIKAAQAIRAALPTGGPLVVALLQDAAPDSLAKIITEFRPDLLQLHGRESPVLAAGLPLPWIKAVPMGEPQVWADWESNYTNATALLADSHTGQGGGGSGQAFAWSALPMPTQRRLPLMLAGGLKPETVGDAIRALRPWAVDVSSGIEAGTKGVKDASRMRAFVAAVRAADAS